MNNAINAIMNIEHIKTFITVYRVGSFVEVAKEKNIAPSSISRSIATLEEILNTRLFQRTTRKLTPTQAGELYFHKMAPLIEEISLVNQSLIDSTSKPSGQLRISTSVSYGQIVIAPKLTTFRERYPDIKLELILSDGRIDLINDQIDLAIRHGNLPDSSLIARKLTDVKYHLVCSKQYLEQNGAPEDPQELKNHNLVTFTYSDFRHHWSFKKNNQTQQVTIQPILTATNASAIRQCIVDGLGIALLADWTVSEDLESGKLKELLPTWKISGANNKTAIWLVHPSNRFTPVKTKVFTDFLLGNMN